MMNEHTGDNFLFISAIAGVYSFVLHKIDLAQIHTKYAALTEVQPILTASASIVAICAGIASLYVHVFKKKK